MSKDYNKVGFKDKSGLHLGHGFCGEYFSSASTGKTEMNHCRHFKGHIDELKLWKTAMSKTNIQTHHDNVALLVAHGFVASYVLLQIRLGQRRQHCP